MSDPVKSLTSWQGVLLMALAALLVPFLAGLTVSSMDLNPASAPAPPVELPDFDGVRAFGYLEMQCKLGPRPTGSPTLLELHDRIVAHFEGQDDWQVTTQKFLVLHPRTRRVVTGRNVIASYKPDLRSRVLIGAHYDTRPYADEDPNPRPYIGANDGASGVAVLMELRHHLAELDLSVGVDLVFFDAEELVFGSGFNVLGEYCLGSRNFARAWSRRRGRPVYRAAVILDMVGGRDAAFYPEEHSVSRAAHVVEQVWRTAAVLGASRFKTLRFRRWKHSVFDDHVPLQQVGIPAIDVIDFDYPHWHRNTDVPANCSAATLDEVGTVVLGWLSTHFGSGRRR